MTQGLFTSMEEIKLYSLMRGKVDTSRVKGFKITRREIEQDNKRIAQNVKRINQRQVQSVWRER